jgi:hypothetical protein
MRHRTLSTLLVLVIALHGLTGCAQSYLPANTGRVSLTGNNSVVKGGQSYGNFWFGAPDAVADNPAAASEARVGKNLAIGGIVFAVSTVGLATAGVAAESSKEHVDTLGWGLLIGELVSITTCFVLLHDASVHTANAINRYNDGVSPAQ